MRRVNAYTEALRLRADWIKSYGRGSPIQVKTLNALGPNPTPDEVDAAFASCADRPDQYGRGNRVQRMFTCHECGLKNLEEVVFVGEEDDHDAHNCHLCPACLLAALQLINE